MVRDALVLTLLLGPLPPLAAQSRDWSPDDRAIIGDYTRIAAVAVSDQRVFAVTPSSVVAWRPLERRWDGPYTPPDPAMLRNVVAALADPLDESLWLVRRDGWSRFDAGIRQWEQGTVPGQVSDAALDAAAPEAGLFLRSSAGWFNAGRGGAAFQSAPPRRPVRAASPDDAVRANPAISALRMGLLFGTGRLREVRYTSAAPASGFTGQGWYLGTAGAGLVYFAEGGGLPERLPFGLPSDVVGAVFAGADGVWAATPRTGLSEPGLSFLSPDLRTGRWFQGPAATGLPFREARRMVGQGSVLWLGTDAGLIRIHPASEAVDRFGDSGPLPDARVLDVAQRRGRIAAGTEHGIVIYDDSTGMVRVAPGFNGAAFAVALGPDTVWVGTRLGLFAAVAGNPDLGRPAGLDEAVSLQAPVLDLAWRGDTLVALTADRLMWRDPVSGRFTLGPLLGAALGRLHTLINGRARLLLAGDRGVAAAGLNTPVLRPLTVPGDLPDQVYDLAVDDEFLWVATRRGLVRFRLELVEQ